MTFSRTLLSGFGALVALLVVASTGLAAGNYVLVTLPFTHISGSHAITTQGTARMCGGWPEGCNPNLALLMGPISSASVGTTLWRDTSSPHFDALVANLTNGVNDPFSIAFNGGGNYGYEHTIMGSQVGPNGVDLGGFIIDRIGFRVDAASFVSPGGDYAHDGIWTDINVQGAFIIEGTCGSLPTIRQPADLEVRSCPVTPTPFTIASPKCGSACNNAPTLSAVLVAGRQKTPIKNPTLALPPGSYLIYWTVDDNFNTASARQNLTVIADKRLCTRETF